MPTSRSSAVTFSGNLARSQTDPFVADCLIRPHLIVVRHIQGRTFLSVRIRPEKAQNQEPGSR